MFGLFRKDKAPEVPTGPDGPDFSAVDTPKKAKALVKQGVLEPMHLVPPEFGGPDNAQNMLYVPAGVADIKRSIDLNQVLPLIEQGQEIEYGVEPEYQGDSFVPMAFTIHAGPINATINVWGEALKRG